MLIMVVTVTKTMDPRAQNQKEQAITVWNAKRANEFSYY